MARPVKYQHRREFQADDLTDKMVNDWRDGTKLSYAEAVRDMIARAASEDDSPELGNLCI